MPHLVAYAAFDDTVRSNPEATRRDLGSLRLRYPGHLLPPDDPRVQPWMDPFEAASGEQGSTLIAWSAVCLALITHPDFYAS